MADGSGYWAWFDTSSATLTALVPTADLSLTATAPSAIDTSLLPILTDDASTVAHVWWRTGGMEDTKGNVWTQNGTVPQVTRSGLIPAGAGPFDDANFYSLGSGADVLDFSGNFSVCMVVDASAFSGFKALFSNGLYPTDGYSVDCNAGTAWRMITTANSVSTANGLVLGAPNVVCFGRDSDSGGNMLLKANLGTLATAGSGAGPATTRAAWLGISHDGTGRGWPGTIYEAFFSSVKPTDALFAEWMNTIKTALSISAW